MEPPTYNAPKSRAAAQRAPIIHICTMNNDVKSSVPSSTVQCIDQESLFSMEPGIHVRNRVSESTANA